MKNACRVAIIGLLVLGMLGFSSALALPFMLCELIPRWLASLVTRVASFSITTCRGASCSPIQTRENRRTDCLASSSPVVLLGWSSPRP